MLSRSLCGLSTHASRRTTIWIGGGGGGGEKRTLTGCFYGLVPEQEGEGGGAFWVSGDPSCCPGACVVFQHMQAGGQRFGYGGGGGGGGEKRTLTGCFYGLVPEQEGEGGGGLFG